MESCLCAGNPRLVLFFFIVSVFSIEDVMSSKVLRDMEHGWPGQLASKTT